jgi:hypothetical protein
VELQWLKVVLGAHAGPASGLSQILLTRPKRTASLRRQTVGRPSNTSQFSVDPLPRNIPGKGARSNRNQVYHLQTKQEKWAGPSSLGFFAAKRVGLMARSKSDNVPDRTFLTVKTHLLKCLKKLVSLEFCMRVSDELQRLQFQFHSDDHEPPDANAGSEDCVLWQMSRHFPMFSI